jgi:hypothetical protein
LTLCLFVSEASGSASSVPCGPSEQSQVRFIFLYGFLSDYILIGCRRSFARRRVLPERYLALGILDQYPIPRPWRHLDHCLPQAQSTTRQFPRQVERGGLARHGSVPWFHNGLPHSHHMGRRTIPLGLLENTCASYCERSRPCSFCSLPGVLRASPTCPHIDLQVQVSRDPLPYHHYSWCNTLGSSILPPV